VPGSARWRRRQPPAGSDAGFTLIESLVALTILAVSAVSLLMATEAYVARIDGLESRALAQLVAENRLAEIELGLEPNPGPAVVLGRAFRVAETRTPTEDPELERVDVEVTDLARAATYRGFVGFVDTGSPR
jgi:general secretion pathway protein I